MKRRIALILTTLAVLLGAFYGYTLIAGRNGLDTSRTPNMPALPPPSGRSDGNSTGLLRDARDVEVIARDERGRLEGVYRADLWDRLPDGSQVLTNPHVELYQKDGRQLILRADRAQVYGEELSSGVNIRRASLQGNVTIYFDTSTEDNRPPIEQRLDEVVRVHVDKVDFDREHLAITTEKDAKVTVFSPNADLYGRGLTISWDESPRELRLLRIEQGEYMAVYNVPTDLGALPGGEMSATGDTPDAATPDEPATTSVPTTQPTSAPATQPAKPLARNQYLAQFHKNVKVIHGNRRLTNANVMSLRFDWDEKWRDRSGGLFDRPRKAPPRDANAATTTAPSTRPARGEPMEIYWSGPLVIRPTGRTETPSQDSYELSAEGPRMVMTDPQATLLCSRFSYEHPQRRGWIEGRTDQPVRLLLGEGADVSCGRIRFEPGNGKAWLYGAGHMARRFVDGLTQEQAVELIEVENPNVLPGGERITWGRSVELSFDNEKIRRADGTTAVRQNIRDATFYQDVELRQTDDPNGDMLQCRDSLKVAMARGKHNSMYPTSAVAIGNVRARQEGSDISAGKVTVNFVEAPPKPDKPGQAPAGTGGNMFSGSGRILPATVIAEGGVKIADRRDPNEPLIASADRIVSKLIEGLGQKRTALLTGSPGEPVRISQGSNRFIGETIRLDQTDDSAVVNGPGELNFVTSKDMDGKVLPEPRLVKVRWGKKMSFSGQKRTAAFSGDVRLDSDLDNVSAQDLQLVFTKQLTTPDEAAKAKADKAKAKPASLAMDMEQYNRRRIAMIFADKDIVLASKRLDRRNRLLRRMQLTGEKLIYDADGERITMLGHGTFINEDYSAPKPRKITGDDGIMPAIGRPSQSAFEWKKSMELSQAERVVTLNGGVTMVNRSADQILLSNKLNVPRDTWGKLPAGRKTILKCGGMMAKFGAPADKATTSPAAKTPRRLGGDPLGQGPTMGPLDLFSASGNVNLKDGPRQVLAQRIIYNGEKDLAVIWGYLPNQPRAKASLIYEQADLGRTQTWSSPKLIWYRQDNRILAENVSGGGGR